MDGPSWPTVHKDRNYHLQKERRVNRGCAVESHSCLDTCPSSIFFKVRPAGFFVWQVSTTRHSFDGSTVKKASWWRRVQSSFGFIFMFLTPSIIAYIFPHASTASYPPNLTSLTILAPQPPRKTTVNVIFNGDAMPPSCLIVASRLIVFFFLSLLFWDNIKKKAPMEARSLTTSDQNFILCGNGFKPTATYFNNWKKKVLNLNILIGKTS